MCVLKAALMRTSTWWSERESELNRGGQRAFMDILMQV